MKIENKNKQDAFKRYIERTGKGMNRAFNSRQKVNEKALEIMRTKPYGMGKKETKHGEYQDESTGESGQGTQPGSDQAE